jgi:DNA-directed RNA polymerase subunit RPC12/RpoP
MEMPGYTILYKCNRCGVVSSELGLFCHNCGARLITKPILRAMETEKKEKEEDETKQN